MNDCSWLSRLSEALQLEPSFSQDWGICNADPSRVDEFLSFYTSHEIVHPWEPEALAELLLESFNELLLCGPLTSTQDAALSAFIAENREDFPNAVEYWTSLDPEAYPVSKYLGRVAK